MFDALTYAGNLVDLARRRRRPAVTRSCKGNICDRDAARRGDGRPRRRRALRGREPRRPLDRRPRRLRQHQLLRHQRRVRHRPPARRRAVRCTSPPTRSTARSRSGSSTETDPLEPRSPYSASKAGSDLIALSYHSTYGLPVVVTRCTNNFGPYQFPEKVIPLFVTNLLDGRPVPLYGDGLNVRDWCYVDDHCARRRPRAATRATSARSTTSAPATRSPNRVLTDQLLALLGDGDEHGRVRDRPPRPRPPLLGRHHQGHRPRLAQAARRSTRRSRRPSPGTATTAGGGSRSRPRGMTASPSVRAARSTAAGRGP